MELYKKVEIKSEKLEYFINTIYDKIREDLRDARLHNWLTDDGDNYPLIDRLSNSKDISTGITEIDNIVEQIEIDKLLEEYAAQFQPVEQPSDEDIEIYADYWSLYTKGNRVDNYHNFIEGAKAMRDGKITKSK